MPYESCQGYDYLCTNPLEVPRYTFMWLSTATSFILSPSFETIPELQANVWTEIKWGIMLCNKLTNLAVQSSETVINWSLLMSKILFIFLVCSLKIVKYCPVYLLNTFTLPFEYPMIMTNSVISSAEIAEPLPFISKRHLPDFLS